MRCVSAPSILHNMRTHTGRPTRPLEANRIWARDTPWLASAEMRAGAPGMLHPILQCVAPPGCAARVVRLPVGVLMQSSIDIIVGAAALGFALACAMTGQTEMARAYLQEHGLHVVLFGSAVVFCVSAGVVGGFWLHMLAP